MVPRKPLLLGPCGSPGGINIQIPVKVPPQIPIQIQWDGYMWEWGELLILGRKNLLFPT
jgi:hypothetical protein